MKRVLTILFVLFMLVGCGPTDHTHPTLTPVNTEIPAATVTEPVKTGEPTGTNEPIDIRRWWEYPPEDWPTHVDGLRVAYLQVTENVLLRRVYTINGDTRVFVISTVKNLRPGVNTIPSQRVEAKAGKVIMVIANPAQIPGEGPGIYRNVPFSDYARPFKGDGGNHMFWVMEENLIDGILLSEHPGTPLFLPLGQGGYVILEPYYPAQE